MLRPAPRGGPFAVACRSPIPRQRYHRRLPASIHWRAVTTGWTIERPRNRSTVSPRFGKASASWSANRRSLSISDASPTVHRRLAASIHWRAVTTGWTIERPRTRSAVSPRFGKASASCSDSLPLGRRSPRPPQRYHRRLSASIHGRAVSTGWTNDGPRTRSTMSPRVGKASASWSAIRR